MNTVLITGGTGLIGKAVSSLLLKNGYAVRYLSRRAGVRNGVEAFRWDPSSGSVDDQAFEGVLGIIHLAGAPIAPKRWTASRVEILRQSRGGAAKLLHEACIRTGCRPEFFISASGANFHGAVTLDKVLTETDQPGDDTIAQITIDWENQADLFSDRCRVVKLRTPIVISKDGGALPKLIAPVKFGLGASFGTGKQWMPWVHIDDIAQAYFDSVRLKERSGIYHVVAPEHVNNKTFMRTCAAALSRPLWLPNIPKSLLYLALGEQASILVEGTRISGERISTAGHSWRFPSLEEAIAAELG